jgi:hypothetical protein
MEDWRQMKIEEIEYNPETRKVRLRLTTGGYRGEYGSYREDRVTVELDAQEVW